ncbi:MAG: hypothetical protein JWP87_6474 [Labilithrix sp.]|nr:hypothetical protein [Labilithrix sp.]
MNKSSTNSSSSTRAQSEQDGKIVDQAKQAVTHVASNVAEQAREQVNTQFDTRKDKAVQTMGNVASAIRETSDKLKGVGPLGDVAGRAADSIENVAQFFEGKQIGEVVRDVERFARREPALFLGAAFALGLIGGRFLKSSAPRRSDAGPDARGAAGGSVSGMSYDRYGEAYGSSYGEGTYDDSFLSDDDLEDDVESYRFEQQQQRAGRITQPQGSRSFSGSQSSGSSYGASQGSYGSSQSTYGGSFGTSQGSTAQASTTPSGSGTSATPSITSTGGSTPGSTPNGVSKSGSGGSQGSV